MWCGNIYLWFGVRFLTRQTYGCIYGLLGACAEVPTEGGRTCSILCFDLHIPPLLIIVNLNRHYDNCNKVNMLIELDGISNKFDVQCSMLFYFEPETDTDSSSPSSSDENVNFEHNVWRPSKQAGPRA